MAPLYIERRTLPKWLPDDETDADTFAAEFGGSYAWSVAILSLFRSLVAPGSYQTFPTVPVAGDAEAGMGYWNPLAYLLIYSLGWTRPDRSLRWWYEAGQPVDDPRFRLIQHLWGADGTLRLFTLWSTQRRFELDSLSELNCLANDIHEVQPNPEWEAARNENLAAGHICSPESLHLEMHCGEPLGEPSGWPTVDIGTATDLRATLTCDSMMGWYNALVHAARKLPNPEHRWTIDIIIKPVRWLGSYRRSTRTGLWFSGPHRYHVPGT